MSSNTEQAGLSPEQRLVPIIPVELMRSPHWYTDARLYFEAALLDDSTDGCFKLPPLEEMAKLCACSRRNLTDAYKRLHDMGWLKWLNKGLPGPTQRKYVYLRRIETRIQQAIVDHEGIAIAQIKSINARLGADDQVYIRYKLPTFPSELLALHQSCKITDKNNTTLADISLADLWEISGHASVEDITTAINEVEHYDRPKSGMIRDIVSVYRSRFSAHKNGTPTGRINQSRSRKFFQSHPKQSTKSSATIALSERQKLCPIYPIDSWPADEIDRICHLLNDERDIRRGEVPLYFSELIFIKIDYQTDVILLSEDIEGLHRVSKGYWQPYKKPLQSQLQNRSCASSPKGIGEAVQPMIERLASNR